MESIMAPYGFAGDFFAIVLCISCMSVLRSSYTIKQTNLKLFYAALFIITCSSGQSIVFHSMLNQPLASMGEIIVFFSLQNSVLIGLQVLLLVMLEYIFNLFLFTRKQKNKIRVFTWPVVAIYLIYKFYTPLHEMDVFINKSTGMIENYGLQDNIYIYVYGYLFIWCAGTIIKHRKLLIEHVYRCLLVNAFLAFGIMIFSYIFNITTFICISFTLPVLAVLFLFHYNAYDTKTGTLDLKAFKSYVHDIGKKTPFVVLSLYLKKDILDKNERLSKNFVTYIQETFADRSRYCLFRVANNHFILVYIKGDDTETELALLEMRIKYGLNWLYNKHGLPYQLLYIDSSHDLISEDYIGLSHYLLKKASLNTCKVCFPKDIEDYRQYVLIDSIFNEMQKTNNLDDERVIVHYQPIMDKNGQCKKAEALMRLKIDDTMYYPGDFLPIVENENYSHFITKIMLNKVCGHIKELEANNYQFEKISINLSTEDLLINDGYKDLIDIVENRHRMTFDKIAFEILENTDKVQYEPLVKAMIAFKSVTGVEFYLDDFGSGYSNLLRLLSLPVNIIKFDKDILKKIKKSSAVFSTVQTNVQTFLDAGYNVLFEGVEDEADISACQAMNIDYYQGYAYAKPSELDKLKTFFKKAEQ